MRCVRCCRGNDGYDLLGDGATAEQLEVELLEQAEPWAASCAAEEPADAKS